MIRIYIFFLLLLPCISGRTQSAEEILDRYYQATGGIENWKKVETMYMESYSWFDQTAASGTTSFERPDSTLHVWYVRWPDRSMNTLYKDGRPDSYFLTIGNKRYIRISNMPVIEQKATEIFNFMPVRIDEMRRLARSLNYLGVVTIKNVHCHLIEITTKNEKWHLMFDQETSLLRFWSHNPDEAVSTLTTLSDYISVEGLLIPRIDTKETSGQLFFYSRISVIRLNDPIDHEIFSLPE